LSCAERGMLASLPGFAREASEGDRAGARRAKAGGCCRELRLGKPLVFA
jgi:hypothetical protein